MKSWNDGAILCKSPAIVELCAFTPHTRPLNTTYVLRGVGSDVVSFPITWHGGYAAGALMTTEWES